MLPRTPLRLSSLFVSMAHDNLAECYTKGCTGQNFASTVLDADVGINGNIATWLEPDGALFEYFMASSGCGFDAVKCRQRSFDGEARIRLFSLISSIILSRHFYIYFASRMHTMRVINFIS